MGKWFRAALSLLALLEVSSSSFIKSTLGMKCDRLASFSSNYLIILITIKVNFSTWFTFLQKLSHAHSVGSFWFYSHALNARCEENFTPSFFGSLMIFSSGVCFQLLAPPLLVSFAMSAVFRNLRLHTLLATNLRQKLTLGNRQDLNWLQILILKSRSESRS